MSKGLKELKELIIKLKSLGYTRCDEWLGFIIIERELKALEIIKEKLSPLARYTFLPMTQEEFNLVEEILNNDD